MTDEQKNETRRLRASGAGYKAIAATLGVSVGTVQSFCRRNGLDPESMKKITGFCEQCGKPLTKIPGKKAKRFCCDKCRMDWWNSHPEKVRHRNVRTVVCPGCGREVTVWGNAERKYCSHACYIRMRFGGAA